MEKFECDAMLFDLDGVLVDSTPAVERVWRDWAGRRGLNADYILSVAHGRRTTETIQMVAPQLDAESEAAELALIESGNMEGILEAKGAHDLLSALPVGSWGVVTSGTRKLATGRIEHFDLPIPEAFVTAEDVVKGKPDPEAYLRGAELLGVRPESCVVIEDAPSGIQAAKSAGMPVVALATTHDPAELSTADVVADSLLSVNLIVETARDGEVPTNLPRLTMQLDRSV